MEYEEDEKFIDNEKVNNLKEIFHVDNFTALSIFNKNYQNTSDFLSYLGTSSSGLSNIKKDDIENRKRIYGRNDPNIKYANFKNNFTEVLKMRFYKYFLILSLLSIISGIAHKGSEKGWIKGTAILIFLISVILIVSLRNYYKERILNIMEEENLKKEVIVRRNDEDTKIQSKDLVVGDILKVKEGDRISVDGIIIEGKIIVDETLIKGSENVQKFPNFLNEFYDKVTPFCMSNTYVREGEGYIVVCCVGKNSSNNLKFSFYKNSECKTKLTTKLEYLYSSIEELSLYVGALLFMCLFVKEITICLYYGRQILCLRMINFTLNSLLISISLIIVGIPESIQMANFYANLLSLRSLKEKGVLIKHLDAFEKASQIDYFICNKIDGKSKTTNASVKQIYFEGKNFNLKEFKARKTQKIFGNDNNLDYFFKSIVNNSFSSNDIDDALKQLLIDLEVKSSDFMGTLSNEDQKPLPFSKDLKISASIHKFSNEFEERIFLFIKGYPERFMDINGCISYIIGCNDDMEGVDLYSLMETQKKFEESGYIPIMILYKEIFSDEELESIKFNCMNNWESVLSELTAVALIGIEKLEIVEEGILKKINEEMNLKIIKVTDDNIHSAITRSSKLGLIDEREKTIISMEINQKLMIKNKKKEINNLIEQNKKDKLEGLEYYKTDLERYSFLNKKDKTLNELNSRLKDLSKIPFKPPIAIDGKEFSDLSGGYEDYQEEFDFSRQFSSINLNLTNPNNHNKKAEKKRYILKNVKQFQNIISNLKIIYSATPTHRLLAAIGLKEDNSIVASCGKYDSDNKLLKFSDIGFSEEAGSDFAKEASDIILLNNSYENIYTTIKISRKNHENVKKLIQFQLSSIIVSTFFVLIGGLTMRSPPMNTMQLLWVKIVTDFIISFSLLNDNCEVDYKLFQQGRKKQFINRFMLINIASQSFFQIFLLMTIIFYGDAFFGYPSDRNIQYDEIGKHSTVIFNIFIYFIVFNSINSRKLLRQELNVFSNMDSKYFISIISIILIQDLFNNYCGSLFKSKPIGNWTGISCLLIGTLPLLIGFLVRLLPFFDEENPNQTNQL